MLDDDDDDDQDPRLQELLGLGGVGRRYGTGRLRALCPSSAFHGTRLQTKKGTPRVSGGPTDGRANKHGKGGGGKTPSFSQQKQPPVSPRRLVQGGSMTAQIGSTTSF